MRIPALPFMAALYLTACTLSAQQGLVIPQHFKSLPPGQYRQTSQAYRGGQPVGQPIVDTHCAISLSPQSVNAARQLQATAAPNCSMKLTIDTPTTAEWLQTCDPGVMQTLIRTTFKLVDDRTITTDMNMSIGGQDATSSHSTLKYLGACPAGMAPPAGPQMPTVPKPSAEDCAQLPEMREQAKNATVESCRTSDLPPAYVARCEASMKILKEHMQQLEAMCKR